MHFSNLLSFSNKIINKLELRLKRAHLVSRPVELTLEPTLQCNSNCAMCNRNFSRKEAKKVEGFLSWDIFWKVRPFFKYAESVLFSGFGEPLLHPEYLAMLREIKKSGPFVYFYTNGVLLTEGVGKGLMQAGTDLICISMGGATRETYKKIRGIDAFEDVVGNLKQISRLKKMAQSRKPRLSFNVVAMASLLPELESLVHLAHQVGVDNISFPNLVAQGDSMREESLWHEPEKAKNAFRTAKDLAEKLNIKFGSPRLDICQSDCTDLFKKTYITWDGIILSCALERFLVGDLREKSLGAIWNSDGMVKMRRDYYRKGLKIMCANCPCWDNRPEVFLSPWLNSREYAQRLF
jgi:MoaA/NifB/PqqE/SkfB family radical SAM enzyme